ncbi:MAG: ATP-binding protein [Saprospiraceae bacterium]
MKNTCYLIKSSFPIFLMLGLVMPTLKAQVLIGSEFKQVFLEKEGALEPLVSNPTETILKDFSWSKFEIEIQDSLHEIYLGTNLYQAVEVFVKEANTWTKIPQIPYPLVDFFRLHLPKGKHTFLIAYKPYKEDRFSTIKIPLQLLSHDSFELQYGYARFFGICFLGAILLFAFYHLLLFFVTKDLSYLYYFLFVSCIGFFCLSMNPYLAQQLYGEMNPTSGIPFFLGAVSLTFHLALFWAIFNLKNEFRQINKWINWIYILIGLGAIIGLLGFFKIALFLLIPLSATSMVIMTWFNLKLLFEKSISGLFFFIGTLLFTLSTFLLLGMLVEWLPSTVLGMTIGLQMELFYVLGAIFWASSLSARISQMNKDATIEEIENQRLKRIQEQELLSLLEEQNKSLEENVAERTQNLKEKNEELEASILQLKEAQSQLIDKEKMASLGQLTAGVAHEINNPINFISNGISNLKLNYQDLVNALKGYLALDTKSSDANDLQSVKEKNKALEISEIIEENKILFKSINNGVERTRKIVNSLSTFSNETGESFLPTDLHACLDSTLEILKNKLKNQIEIQKDYQEIPKVECQESRINQVFLNIINNAAQAIEGNGTISIKTWKENENVHISIQDSGAGMDAKTQKKVFDPFFTTKDIGVGTGLGLSISYKIIEQHNGAINFESAVGKGTTFFIKLPISQKQS